MSSGPIIDLSVLPTFLPAAVLICVAPGPDMFYLLATGIAAGRSAAVRGVLGITVGVFVYVVAVAAGLGSVIARFPAVVVALQAFGALYLLYLAWGTYKDAAVTPELRTDLEAGTHWFRRGLIVDLTNPKIILFFLAFFPGFLGRSRNPALQLLVLGLLFQVIGLATDFTVAWSTGSLRDKVLARPAILRAMTYTSAGVLLVLAVIIGIDAVARGLR
jgi:threonine/homoserine/homoserine lactone efflux protein